MTPDEIIDVFRGAVNGPKGVFWDILSPSPTLSLWVHHEGVSVGTPLNTLATTRLSMVSDDVFECALRFAQAANVRWINAQVPPEPWVQGQGQDDDDVLFPPGSPEGRADATPAQYRRIRGARLLLERVLSLSLHVGALCWRPWMFGCSVVVRCVGSAFGWQAGFLLRISSVADRPLSLVAVPAVHLLLLQLRAGAGRQCGVPRKVRYRSRTTPSTTRAGYSRWSVHSDHFPDTAVTSRREQVDGPMCSSNPARNRKT